MIALRFRVKIGVNMSTVKFFPKIKFLSGGSSFELTSENISSCVDSVREYVANAAQPGDRVGLIFKTSPELIAIWLACLERQLIPVLLSYPTEKQKKDAYVDSVRNSFNQIELSCILLDRYAFNILSSSDISLSQWNDDISFEQSSIRVFDFNFFVSVFLTTQLP